MDATTAHRTRSNLPGPPPPPDPVGTWTCLWEGCPDFGVTFRHWAPTKDADIQHHHETVHGIHPDRHTTRTGAQQLEDLDGGRR